MSRSGATTAVTAEAGATAAGAHAEDSDDVVVTANNAKADDHGSYSASESDFELDDVTPLATPPLRTPRNSTLQNSAGNAAADSATAAAADASRDGDGSDGSDDEQLRWELELLAARLKGVEMAELVSRVGLESDANLHFHAWRKVHETAIDEDARFHVDLRGPFEERLALLLDAFAMSVRGLRATTTSNETSAPRLEVEGGATSATSTETTQTIESEKKETTNAVDADAGGDEVRVSATMNNRDGDGFDFSIKSSASTVVTEQHESAESRLARKIEALAKLEAHDRTLIIADAAFAFDDARAAFFDGLIRGKLVQKHEVAERRAIFNARNAELESIVRSWRDFVAVCDFIACEHHVRKGLEIAHRQELREMIDSLAATQRRIAIGTRELRLQLESLEERENDRRAALSVSLLSHLRLLVRIMDLTALHTLSRANGVVYAEATERFAIEGLHHRALGLALVADAERASREAIAAERQRDLAALSRREQARRHSTASVVDAVAHEGTMRLRVSGEEAAQRAARLATFAARLAVQCGELLGRREIATEASEAWSAGVVARAADDEQRIARVLRVRAILREKAALEVFEGERRAEIDEASQDAVYFIAKSFREGRAHVAAMTRLFGEERLTRGALEARSLDAVSYLVAIAPTVCAEVGARWAITRDEADEMHKRIERPRAVEFAAIFKQEAAVRKWTNRVREWPVLEERARARLEREAAVRFRDMEKAHRKGRNELIHRTEAFIKRENENTTQKRSERHLRACKAVIRQTKERYLWFRLFSELNEVDEAFNRREQEWRASGGQWRKRVASSTGTTASATVIEGVPKFIVSAAPEADTMHPIGGGSFRSGLDWGPPAAAVAPTRPRTAAAASAAPTGTASPLGADGRRRKPSIPHFGGNRNAQQPAPEAAATSAATSTTATTVLSPRRPVKPSSAPAGLYLDEQQPLAPSRPQRRGLEGSTVATAGVPPPPPPTFTPRPPSRPSRADSRVHEGGKIAGRPPPSPTSQPLSPSPSSSSSSTSSRSSSRSSSSSSRSVSPHYDGSLSPPRGGDGGSPPSSSVVLPPVASAAPATAADAEGVVEATTKKNGSRKARRRRAFLESLGSLARTFSPTAVATIKARHDAPALAKKRLLLQQHSVYLGAAGGAKRHNVPHPPSSHK